MPSGQVGGVYLHWHGHDGHNLYRERVSGSEGIVKDFEYSKKVNVGRLHQEPEDEPPDF